MENFCEGNALFFSFLPNFRGPIRGFWLVLAKKPERNGPVWDRLYIKGIPVFRQIGFVYNFGVQTLLSGAAPSMRVAGYFCAFLIIFFVNASERSIPA